MDNRSEMENGMAKAIAIKNRVVLESFTDLCEAALLHAISSHTFKNRTYNLENSFSYGIFHKGLLVREKSIGSSDGANDAKAFLSSYVSKRDWSAVIVAGAWYGTLLEKFKTSRGNSFIVLSDSFDFVTLEHIQYFKKHSVNG